MDPESAWERPNWRLSPWRDPVRGEVRPLPNEQVFSISIRDFYAKVKGREPNAMQLNYYIVYELFNELQRLAMQSEQPEKVARELAESIVRFGRNFTPEMLDDASKIASDLVSYWTGHSVEPPLVLSPDDQRLARDISRAASAEASRLSVESFKVTCDCRFIDIALEQGLQCRQCGRKGIGLSIEHVYRGRRFGNVRRIDSCGLICRNCETLNESRDHNLFTERFVSEYLSSRYPDMDMRQRDNIFKGAMAPRYDQAWHEKQRAEQLPADWSAFQEDEKIGRDPASMRFSEWQAIRVRQRDRCAACGAEGNLTMDHIVPRNKGGSHAVDNIQGLCGSCNSAKQDRDWTEFLATRRTS